MFDLNAQLKKWNSQLKKSESFKSGDIDELEDQVLEKTKGLQEKGLTEEEAFWVAVHQVGDPDSLNGEYRKINLRTIWQKRLFWIFGGYVFITALHYLLKIPSGILYSFWNTKAIATENLNTYFILDSVFKVLFMAALAALTFSDRFKDYLVKKVLNRDRKRKQKPLRTVLFLLPFALFLGAFTFGNVSFFIQIKPFSPDRLHMFLTSLFEPLWLYFFFALFILVSLSLFREKRRISISRQDI
jgi:hypothetical protein